MIKLLFVALGGAAGAVLRHLVSIAVSRMTVSSLPWATLMVNVSGCLAMGFVFYLLRDRLGSPLHLLMATGMLGGYTTFSAFSLETVLLWQRGEIAGAVAYVLASVVLTVAALAAGMAMAKWIAGG